MSYVINPVQLAQVLSNVTVEGSGTPGTPLGGVLSVQGVSAGTPIPVTGGNRLTTTVTIASGANLSPAADLGANYMAVGLQTPSAWTSADITFQVSTDNITFVILTDTLYADLDITMPPTLPRQIPLDPVIWGGVRYVKIQSGTSSIPVNQGADRVFTFIRAPL